MLAQTVVNDKSNKITAIPELLRRLCLGGCFAILERKPSGWGSQKAIARQIREQGANYQDLYGRMEDMVALERVMDFAVCSRDDADTVGKDHDRIEPHLVWDGRASVRRILYMATVTALRKLLLILNCGRARRRGPDTDGPRHGQANILQGSSQKHFQTAGCFHHYAVRCQSSQAVTESLRAILG